MEGPRARAILEILSSEVVSTWSGESQGEEGDRCVNGEGQCHGDALQVVGPDHSIFDVSLGLPSQPVPLFLMAFYGVMDVLVHLDLGELLPLLGHHPAGPSHLLHVGGHCRLTPRASQTILVKADLFMGSV